MIGMSMKTNDINIVTSIQAHNKTSGLDIRENGTFNSVTMAV
jgi:hypothetical protein